uniref:Immunoglobulin I-set domain-containing protein n=1 Tax=Glossina pallidipes TaxID=7398 RepID=A0A1A9ZVS1_GLOPL
MFGEAVNVALLGIFPLSCLTSCQQAEQFLLLFLCCHRQHLKHDFKFRLESELHKQNTSFAILLRFAAIPYSGLWRSLYSASAKADFEHLNVSFHYSMYNAVDAAENFRYCPVAAEAKSLRQQKKSIRACHAVETPPCGLHPVIFNIIDHNRLTLRNLTMLDGGDYECVVKSSVNEISAKTNVVVEGAPGAPGGGQLVDIGKTKVLMEWIDGANNRRPIRDC